MDVTIIGDIALTGGVTLVGVVPLAGDVTLIGGILLTAGVTLTVDVALIFSNAVFRVIVLSSRQPWVVRGRAMNKTSSLASSLLKSRSHPVHSKWCFRL